MIILNSFLFFQLSYCHESSVHKIALYEISVFINKPEIDHSVSSAKLQSHGPEWSVVNTFIKAAFLFL